MKWRTKPKNSDVWIVLAATIVFVLCTYIATVKQVFLPLEESFFYAAYSLPEFVRLPMYILTQLGSAGALITAVIVAYVCGRKRLAVLLFASGSLAFVATWICKMLVARPRPAGVLPDVVVHFDSVDGFGFPSGHTALVTAIAFTLMPFVAKEYRIVLWLMIVGVGLSRMVLGAHVPLDVLGGFCIGVIAAVFVRAVINRTTKHKKH